MARKYQIAEQLDQVCRILGLDPKPALLRARLPEDWLTQPNNMVTIEEYFRIWSAVHDMADRPDVELFLAKTYAHGPFAPPILAFSSSDTIYLGLQRLAVFKELMGPFRLLITRDGTGLSIQKATIEPGYEIPKNFNLFEACFMVEACRAFSGVHIIPQEVVLKGEPRDMATVEDFFGVTPKIAPEARVVLKPEDADLPLITRSPSLWENIEEMLTRRLREQQQANDMSFRVKQVLANALPAGAVTADTIARRLNTSKRSLQRRLTEEGTNFQDILTEVRGTLSERYLKDSDLSVPEISHLLGFRDTSSFFRAFQKRTGMTPGEYRQTPSETRLN